MNFLAITIIAGTAAVALIPSSVEARASREPVFSELSPPAASPLATNSAAPRPLTPVTAAVPAVSSNSAPSLSAYVADDKYKLRAGDKISLQILEDRDQPKGLLIADSGELDAPYIGRVAAADKTCKQLAAELKALLEKEYYYRATVIISLDAANKVFGRIYVTGQVKNQGPIDMAINENLTASRAIMRAGGFGDFANRKKVKIVRGGSGGGAGKQTFELNMIEILDDGKTEKDIPVQPDDWIIVPSRLINF
jgi:protein involved in polysaccharide export with SLBB domain